MIVAAVHEPKGDGEANAKQETAEPDAWQQSSGIDGNLQMQASANSDVEELRDFVQALRALAAADESPETRVPSLSQQASLSASMPGGLSTLLLVNLLERRVAQR